ncbi:MAG: fibrillarin-like rRNA/tRNA 2'-O-methyltransferase, partial [Candidatus Kariarchaeaceae archaeon]
LNLKKVKMMDQVWQLRGFRGIEYVTKNAIPGKSVYGERLFDIDGVEYREWQHKKSKLASGMINNLRIPSIQPGASVLYLGASAGTTVSHVSDIVGDDGVIYAIEFAPRPGRDLYTLSDDRDNIVPIIADARYPQQYSHLVDQVDIVYCDVAQPTQSQLFLDNASAFLRNQGQGYIAIKTKSISQTEHPKQIFATQTKMLEAGGFKTIKTTSIGKIHRDHYVYLGTWTR